MTPERWRQVTAVFHAARGREPATRGVFLDQACGGDASLRAEVGALLAAQDEASRAGTGGGVHPRWTRDGKELVYWSPPGGIHAHDVSLSAADPGIKVILNWTSKLKK